MIYFIQAGKEPFVKIGFSRNVQTRIVSYRLFAPDPDHYRLLGVIDGSRAREKKFHKIFAHCVYRGEWFHLTPELDDFIKTLQPNEKVRIPRIMRKRKIPIWHGSDFADITSSMFASRVRENIVAIARAYALAEKVPLSTVSKRAYGQTHFFDKFRRGEASVTLEKAESVLDWFRENWPENADWPLIRPLFMSKEPRKNGG